MEKNSKSQILKPLIFTIHFFNSIIQCYCCMIKKTNIRIITKLLIMPLIYLIYQILTKEKNKNKLINYGMIFGWIGDIFMLSKSNSPLIIGGILFF